MTKDEKFGTNTDKLDELEERHDNMVPPRDMPTDPEITKGTNGDGLLGLDREHLVAEFLKMPDQVKFERLLLLQLATRDEQALIRETRRDFSDHVAEDRQEFDVINAELAHLSRCAETIAAHFNIKLPERPKDRPRRKEK